MERSEGRKATCRWAKGLLRERLRCYERARRAACRDLEDETAVHDLRTQTRRLRVALEVLDQLTPLPRRAEKRIKRVIAATNARRDGTILAALVAQYRHDEPGADPAEAARLSAFIAEQPPDAAETLHALHRARRLRLE